MAGADWPVSAITAKIAGPRRKLAGANVRGNFLNDFLRLVQLFGPAGGGLDLVVLQVMKIHATRIPFEHLSRRYAANATLQVPACI